MSSSSPYFEEIRRAAFGHYPALLQEWFPNGRIEGKQFVVGSVNGEKGKSLKISLINGRWADFAGQQSGGDAISLYAELRHISYKDAGKELGKQLNVQSPLQITTNLWVPITPVPVDAPFDEDGRPPLPFVKDEAKPAGWWCYLSENGEPLYWRVRFDGADGKKDILPLTYCEHARTHERSWRWRDVPAPRPLYGLEWLNMLPEANVLICEGEKATDAARELLPEWVVVAWSGGVKRVGAAHSDWKPLLKRNTRIVLWPDHDREGLRAMAELAEYLGAAAQCVIPNKEWASGWDLADAKDEGWDGARVLEYLDSHIAKPIFEPALSKRRQAILPSGDLAEQSEAIWEAVREVNMPPELFRSDQGLTLLHRDPFGRWARRTADLDRLQNWLTRKIAFTRQTEDGPTKCRPSEAALRNLLVEPSPPIPHLLRLAEVPLYSPAGRLVCDLGYDADSGLFYGAPDDFDIEMESSEIPTVEDVKLARELIFDLIDDFPFVDHCDRAHCVAYAILPLIRLMIRGRTPLFRFEAPAPRTGKSLLMRLLARLTCATISDVSPTKDEEEWRKRLTAALRDDPDAILIDNALEIESAQIKKALTDDIWEDRALGVNSMVRYPVRCVWGISFNNPLISAEIMGRSVRIRLDAGMDRPGERNQFKHKQIEEYAIQNRAALVQALLILVQFGLHHGIAYDGPMLGGYEAFCRRMGSILNACGIGGFLEDRDDENVVSGDEQAFAAFVRLWATQEDRLLHVGRLVELASAIEEFDLGRSDDSRKQAQALGYKLTKHRDMTIDGWKVVPRGRDAQGKRWELFRK